MWWVLQKFLQQLNDSWSLPTICDIFGDLNPDEGNVLGDELAWCKCQPVWHRNRDLPNHWWIVIVKQSAEVWSRICDHRKNIKMRVFFSFILLYNLKFDIFYIQYIWYVCVSTHTHIYIYTFDIYLFYKQNNYF